MVTYKRLWEQMETVVSLERRWEMVCLNLRMVSYISQPSSAFMNETNTRSSISNKTLLQVETGHNLARLAPVLPLQLGCLEPHTFLMEHPSVLHLVTPNLQHQYTGSLLRAIIDLLDRHTVSLVIAQHLSTLNLTQGSLPAKLALGGLSLGFLQHWLLVPCLLPNQMSANQ